MIAAKLVPWPGGQMKTYKFNQLEPETKAHIEATRGTAECVCRPKPNLTEADAPDAWVICGFHRGFDTAIEQARLAVDS